MNVDDYRREKNFFMIYDRLVVGPKLGFESSAIATLEQFEMQSMSKARKGLSLAINDALEDTDEWPIDAVREFDRVLEENDAATLSEIRFKHSKKLRKIIRNRQIFGEVEYYLVKGVLDGMQRLVSSDELALLESILVGYETSKSR